ncbi:hypothetical protein B0H10DRAFT_2209632 [Mycena sp. CBHHK59/15]|nr:hypothetical protein B0H10DRAFT_2209632 [Mycena sp. CBHHK59/15]
MRSVWTRHPSTPGPLGWLAGRWMSPSPPHPPVFAPRIRAEVCAPLDPARSRLHRCSSAPLWMPDTLPADVDISAPALCMRSMWTRYSSARSSQSRPGSPSAARTPHSLRLAADDTRSGWSGVGHHGPRRPLLYSLLKFVPSSVPLWIPHSAHRRLDLSVSGLPPPSSAHVARWYMRATPLSPPLHCCGGTPLMRRPRLQRALPVNARSMKRRLRVYALVADLGVRQHAQRHRVMRSHSRRLGQQAGLSSRLRSAAGMNLPDVVADAPRRAAAALFSLDTFLRAVVRSASRFPAARTMRRLRMNRPVADAGANSAHGVGQTAPPTTRKTSGASIARVALAGPH